MPDHDDRARLLLIEYRGDVGSKVVHIDVIERTYARADTPRLRPQYRKAVTREVRSYFIKVSRPSSKRGQKDNYRSLTLTDGLNRYSSVFG